MNQRTTVDISFSSLLRILLILGIVYILFLIQDVLILIFVASILAVAFTPIVNKWAKTIGKTWAISILVILTVAFITGFISMIVPPLATQTKQFITDLPDLINNSSFIQAHIPSFEKVLNALAQSLGGVETGVITFTSSVVSTIIAFFTVLVLAIYLLIDQQIFQRSFAALIPEDKQTDIVNLLNKISEKIGAWLRGQLLLCLIVGVITYITLLILGVKYALTLAAITAVLEVLPVFGPIIAGALATLISLSVSPISALIVAVIFILVHQIENSFLIPKIMSKAVGLPPAIIIIAILVGGKMIGLLGAVLAVPIAAIVYVIVQEWGTVRKIANR